MIETVTVWLFVNPFLYGVEHVPMNLQALISKSWVVEDSHYVLHNFINRYSRILPCIKNSGSDVLKNGGSNSASDSIQLVREMVL